MICNDFYRMKCTVEIEPLLRGIEASDGVVMLGSCFAQYMGERMQGEGYDVLVNPLGTLFNPFSIHHTVVAALEASTVRFPVFAADGEWRCWWANTRVKAESEAMLVDLLRRRYGQLGDALRKARHLVVTLGTNVCYLLKNPPEGCAPSHAPMVVTNCQRQPDRLFDEWRASLTDVQQIMAATMQRLFSVNPDLQVIFTVSPYRYHKYGYHGSQLSKATLLLAVDAIVHQFPHNCCYFPAYEILLDELRDYSYYGPDAHHPGPGAVDVIWLRFRESFAKII